MKELLDFVKENGFVIQIDGDIYLNPKFSYIRVFLTNGFGKRIYMVTDNLIGNLYGHDKHDIDLALCRLAERASLYDLGIVEDHIQTLTKKQPLTHTKSWKEFIKNGN